MVLSGALPPGGEGGAGFWRRALELAVLSVCGSELLSQDVSVAILLNLEACKEAGIKEEKVRRYRVVQTHFGTAGVYGGSIRTDQRQPVGGGSALVRPTGTLVGGNRAEAVDAHVVGVVPPIVVAGGDRASFVDGNSGEELVAPRAGKVRRDRTNGRQDREGPAGIAGLGDDDICIVIALGFCRRIRRDVIFSVSPGNVDGTARGAGGAVHGDLRELIGEKTALHDAGGVEERGARKGVASGGDRRDSQGAAKGSAMVLGGGKADLQSRRRIERDQKRDELPGHVDGTLRRHGYVGTRDDAGLRAALDVNQGWRAPGCSSV